MAAQGFLARIAGVTKQVLALVTSAGAADAGKIVATGDDGRLDLSLMPLGVGANTTQAKASELLGAGKFVNFYDAAGAFSARLADNSNGRPADGFVTAEFAANAVATVHPLDSTNASLTGLVLGTRYFLGTAGGVIASPLDEQLAENVNKVSQQLGVAKSPTELVTDDHGYVVL